MTDGTFLSRAWPSIVALVGTVLVVLVLLYMFGGDDAGGDETTTDEGQTEEQPQADGPVSPAPDVEQTGTDPTPEQTETPDTPDTPVQAPPELRTPVGILNSTSVAGLAAGAQERFIEGGWEVPVITDYSGTVEGTTAYYPPGSADLQASAEALAQQFREIVFVEPTPADSGLATERVLVILADDYAEAVGATGG